MFPIKFLGVRTCPFGKSEIAFKITYKPGETRIYVYRTDDPYVVRIVEEEAPRHPGKVLNKVKKALPELKGSDIQLWANTQGD